MNLIKANIRCTATNYKNETSVIYEKGYINLDRITNVMIMGNVARVIFSGIAGDYVELDTDEWTRIVDEEVYSGYAPNMGGR